MGARAIKRKYREKMKSLNLDALLIELQTVDAQDLIHPLFSAISSTDQREKMHGIKAFGQTMHRLAEQDMEAARVVMRRFMWMLNDESGGIGWGVPEAFGETLACHKGLAEEYTHILVAFMREDGFYLELESLQQGLMWGVSRLAEVEPKLLLSKKADHYLKVYLQSTDSVVRRLAEEALVKLGNTFHA